MHCFAETPNQGETRSRPGRRPGKDSVIQAREDWDLLCYRSLLLTSNDLSSHHRYPVAVLLLTGGLCLHAQAQPTGMAIGIGVMARQPAYVGVERENRAVPLLFYENSWLRVAGLQADLKAPRHEFNASNALTGGLRIRYEDEGYEPGDSLSLTAMQKRKASAWVGLAGTWHNPIADVSLEWMSDASRNSEASKTQLQVARRFSFEKVSLTPRVQVDWLDNKYVDYYYGVRAVEAAPSRPAYFGHSAVTGSLGLRVDYAIAAPHQVFVDMSLTRLPTEIRDSPLIDRRTTPRAFVGYLYRF